MFDCWQSGERILFTNCLIVLLNGDWWLKTIVMASLKPAMQFLFSCSLSLFPCQCVSVWWCVCVCLSVCLHTQKTCRFRLTHCALHRFAARYNCSFRSLGSCLLMLYSCHFCRCWTTIAVVDDDAVALWHQASYPARFCNASEKVRTEATEIEMFAFLQQ